MEPETTKKTEPRKRAERAEAHTGRAPRAVWFFLGLIILCVAGLRVRLQDTPLQRDEGEYAYVGQLILRGEVPYQRAYTMKFPGTHYAYALILAIFGQTDVGIHQGLLVVNAASIILIFLLASRLFDPSVGVATAGAFGLLSLSKYMEGFTANTEHFVILPMLGGTLLLIHGIEQSRRGLFLAAGVLLGLAVLMKQHAAVFVAFAAVFLVARDWRAWRLTLLRGLHLAVGVALPLSMVFLYLWGRGVFAQFWFWTVTYAQQYATMVPFADGMRALREQSAVIADSSPSLWALAALGVIAAVWDKGRRKRVLFLLLFASFSFLAVCPGFLFREHYFLLFVPAASLLVGVGAAFAGRLFSSSLPASGATAVVAVAAIAVAVIEQRAYLFADSPSSIVRQRYGIQPFLETKEIGLYLQEKADPEDQIAVVGSEPQIYFYARRRAATGFLYTYPLMEPQPYAVQMQKDMIAEIEHEDARFLVRVNVPSSWVRLRNSSPLIFEWMDGYIPDHYRRVGIAEMISEYLTEYRWGIEADKYKPSSRFHVYLFERAASR
jgi:4-amino-4-deoxy-L-arabinose transferase-like glycosyltransferase